MLLHMKRLSTLEYCCKIKFSKYVQISFLVAVACVFAVMMKVTILMTVVMPGRSGSL